MKDLHLGLLGLALLLGACQEPLDKKLRGKWRADSTPLKGLEQPEKGSLRASKDPLLRGVGRVLATAKPQQEGGLIRSDGVTILIKEQTIELAPFYIGFLGRWKDAKPAPFRVIDRDRVEVTSAKGPVVVRVRLSEDGQALSFCPDGPVTPAVSSIGYLFDWDIQDGGTSADVVKGVLCDAARFGTPHRFLHSGEAR